MCVGSAPHFTLALILPPGIGPVEVALAPRTPRGFTTFEEFQQFGADLYNGLRQAGFNDAEAAMQGSSVTRRSAETGQPFDQGRISDFDVALVHDKQSFPIPDGS
jgi:hypothetical protein